ncbi:MAG: hypothetical protein L0H24_14195, partial [Microlunatus sp.]|nr:hypothetical protein [Microlunatus sp.]
TMDPSPPTRTNPVSQLTPTASPWSLPPGYSRHHPNRDDLRQAMDHLASQAEWAELNWAGLVEALLRLGSTDIPLARLVEGHIDALRTLAQADCGPRPGARYGVWASRSAGTGIAAVAEADHLRLDGIIRFASGAGILDRALVPVWLDQDTHLLVDLDVAELPVDRSHWQTSAMRVSQSHTVMVHGVSVSRADVVGEPSFYLHRPAFLPGGVGVAAVWTGGLIRTLDVVVAMLSGRAVSPAQDARLGRARLQLITALTCVRAAGRRLDEILPMERNPTGENAGGDSDDSELIAAVSAESRAVVAGAVMTALAEVRVLAGPAGLAFDPDLGHALDDLGLYVAQLNLDAEVTRLGGELRAGRR